MDVPETFKGNVTYLRFDPFDAFGHMDIDYIRFLTAEEAGVEPEAEEKADEAVEEAEKAE